MENDNHTEKRPNGRPRKGPDPEAPEAIGTGLVAQAIKIDGRRYEQRYTRCGKKCNTCGPNSAGFNPSRPGHGPYWYFVFTRGDGRTTRRYIGKELRPQNTDPNRTHRP